MSDRRRVRACPECWATFSRNSSVRRHVLSVHQLGYVNGTIVTLTSIEIRNHLEALRVQQMSSRTRQRHRTRNAVVANSSPTSRVAVVRRPNENDDDMVTSAGAGADNDTDLWGDWPNFEELSLPVANSEITHTETQTETVDIRDAPSVIYDAETQTSAPQMISVAVMTARPSVRWSTELSFIAAVDHCKNNPTLSANRIVTDLCLPHPNITDEQRNLMLNILDDVTAGIDVLARTIRVLVSEGNQATTERERSNFLNSLAGAWAMLGEFEHRPHY